MSYVQLSRGAFLPAVPLRSLCVKLLLCSDLDIVPTHMLLLLQQNVFSVASMPRKDCSIFVSVLSDTEYVPKNIKLTVFSLLTTIGQLENYRIAFCCIELD